MAKEIEVLPLIREKDYPAFVEKGGPSWPVTYKAWQMLRATEEQEFRSRSFNRRA